MMLALLPSVASADAHIGDFCSNAPDVADFPDVATGGTFETVIDCGAGFGFFSGDTEGNFNPADEIDRGEAAIIVANYIETSLDVTLTETTPNPFTDVAAGGTAESAILKLVEAEVIQGTSATTYEPGASITRGQTVALFYRALEYIGVALDTTDNDQFTDIDGNFFETEIEALANFTPAIVKGFDDGTFRPSLPVLRGEFAQFVTESAYQANEAGLFAPVAPLTNQAFTVTSEDTLLQLSDTGTYPADDGDEIIFTVSGLAAGGEYDLALVTNGGTNRDHSVMMDGNALSFRDQDLNDVADDIGTTYDSEIFISAYGTAFNFTNTAGAGTRHVDGATADSNGELRVEVETTGLGDAAHLVVFDDANNDDALNLDADTTDSWNVPSEDFAVSDLMVYHAGEAPSGYDDCCEEIIFIDKDAQFFVTDDGYFFNYDSTDSYEYAENEFSISFAEANQAFSVGDSMDLYNDVHDFYSRTGPSGFDFEEPDTPGTPINISAAVGDFDDATDADDVQISWDAPAPLNALISQYEVYRAEADDLTIWTSVGTTDFDPNYSNVDTSLVDVDVAAGEYVYRVEAISRTSDEGDMSLLSDAVTVEGPAGPTITSAELTNDDIIIGAIDTGDEITLTFSENLDVIDEGDQVHVTDDDGDLVRFECDTDNVLGAGNVDASCVLTDNVLVITLNADPTNIDAAGDGDFNYPATVSNTAGITASGAETDLENSTDLVIG